MAREHEQLVAMADGGDGGDGGGGGVGGSEALRVEVAKVEVAVMVAIAGVPGKVAGRTEVAIDGVMVRAEVARAEVAAMGMALGAVAVWRQFRRWWWRCRFQCR